MRPTRLETKTRLRTEVSAIQLNKSFWADCPPKPTFCLYSTQLCLGSSPLARTGAATTENTMGVLHIAQKEILNDPAVLLMGVYPEEITTLNQKDTCIPTFTAATFVVAKTGKQPKCPLRDE